MYLKIVTREKWQQRNIELFPYLHKPLEYFEYIFVRMSILLYTCTFQIGIYKSTYFEDT